MDKHAVLARVMNWAKGRAAAARASAESHAADRFKKMVAEVKANPHTPSDSPLKEAIRTELNKATATAAEHSRRSAKKGLAAGVGLGVAGTGAGVATYSHLKKKKK